MNYLIITIDALSKWYIDKLKSDDSFFDFLEKNTYCFSNMYSSGPFTESAVRSFWAGDMPLDGYSYISESRFSSATFFEKYEQSHYMYYGRLVPYFNYKIKADNSMERELSENRAFQHIWPSRLSHYINLYDKGLLRKKDYWKIHLVLDDFFDRYCSADLVMEEKKKYEINKELYIDEILMENTESSFYQNLNNDLYMDCKYRNIKCIQNQKNHELLPSEAVFIKKAKNRNVQLCIEDKKDSLDAIESVLSGEKNRCVVSNNDLLAQMRDENEKLPKLREEIDDFLKWYDENAKELDSPFFAYIHNYDFHFPENFMNSRRDDVANYEHEVKGLIECLDNLQNKSISVSKQLCLKLLEKNLEYLWLELEKRKVFDNTCVIITADHGISNFMSPLRRSNNRWNYTRTNFNVPMYIKAPGVGNFINCDFHSPKNFGDFLKGIEYGNFITIANEKSDSYSYAMWVNGIPEIDRSKIKIGIRNNYWSITCEGYYYQTFCSLDILGIYNLEVDPDEIEEIAYKDAVCSSRFSTLFETMGNIWYEQIYKLIDDELVTRTNDNVIEYKYELHDNREIYTNNVRVEKEKFEQLIKDKEIILYGTDPRYAVEFMDRFANECIIKEIWSENNEHKYFYGHQCTKPHRVDESTFVIVCDRDEIKALSVLRNNNITNIIIYASVDCR